MLQTELDLRTALERRGVSRREFLGFCASMAGVLALPPRYVGRISIVTGFAMYQAIAHTQPWRALFGWLPGWINIQYLRELHFLIMFVFFAFTIHHVYSSLLVSAEEKNGLMGSIFSGHKFLPPRLADEPVEGTAAAAPSTPEPAPEPPEKTAASADD